MRHLLLLGGGHAHVQVVRAFAASPLPGTRVTLISDAVLTPYSGMLPGLVAGHYGIADSHIDLAALCEAAAVEFVEGRAITLDLSARTVETADRVRHAYDLLSIDTGSVTPISAVPGAAAHAVPVKPVGAFLLAVERLVEQAQEGNLRSVAVIGGGAAGFEIALALDHRLKGLRAPGTPPRIHLITDTETILPGLPVGARERAERILAQRSVSVRTSAAVLDVDAEGIRFCGEVLPADAIFFVTGAAPAPMYRHAGLATDERGFIRVNASLQSLSHPGVFACGDVASVTGHPRPKAGVFAVRQGPPLAENLRRAVAGAALVPFVPQRHFLVLLSTGCKHAIAVRNGWSVEGDWVWRWKDWIDRRFMAGFAPDRVRRSR